jgi:hypothetical protein
VKMMTRVTAMAVVSSVFWSVFGRGIG